CSSGDGMSAGGHYNPAGRPHGRHGAGAHHAGDLMSLKADASGVARFDFESRGISVGGGAHAVAAGTIALLVHVEPVLRIGLQAADLAGDDDHVAPLREADGAGGGVAGGRRERGRGDRAGRRGAGTEQGSDGKGGHEAKGEHGGVSWSVGSAHCSPEPVSRGHRARCAGSA
ncbi:MAG: superoxide dismutase family protein, partial [Comamonadaceae bacterium]